jgi:hypothetical protein
MALLNIFHYYKLIFKCPTTGDDENRAKRSISRYNWFNGSRILIYD